MADDVARIMLAVIVFGGSASAFDVWAITHPERFSKFEVLAVNSLAWIAVGVAVRGR